ncbi:MAG: efflux transporter outer membrane subunit [Deltaproteobacteria bacterium]|nr:efflux transporter outer membrane subunit [Deltaproteobacteria bacterium]
MLRRVPALALVLSLSACMLGPDYRRPELDMPKQWRFPDADAVQVAADTAWWEQFNDPALNQLIATALRGNQDLRAATGRVEEFMGRLRVTRAAMFPQADAAASQARERRTEAGTTTVNPGRNASEIHTLVLNAGWEIDLWGKLRRATEAARAELLATEDARLALMQSLVATVAAAYVDLRELDRQLEIAGDTLKRREESYRIYERRHRAGIVPRLELDGVKSQYEAARASIPLIEKLIAQQENALSVLLGDNPGPIPRGRNIDDLTLPEVPAAIPSDLLERRYDIREAEQVLVAANARIGAARALYFPAITLTGFLGTSSKDLSDLFMSPSRIWNYAGTVTVPVFTAGAIAGTVQATEGVRVQALAGYRKAIQNAFREVDDALVDQAKTRVQLEAQRLQVESLASYNRLARSRYRSGYTSYLEVLDSERSLFEAQLAYVRAQAGLMRSLISLYKAMGGGWVVAAEARVPEPPIAQKQADG